MSCCCKENLLNDYKWCPRLVGEIQRKPPNHPDYFGADEFHFIQSFGGDMRRNLQQLRHLKATSTGTAKTLDWLLQGNLEDTSKACPRIACRRRKGAGKLLGNLHGTKSRRAFGLNKDAGSNKKGARRLGGLRHQGLQLRDDKGRPMIPLTFCFNESGHPIPCDPRDRKEIEYLGNYLAANWLRAGGMLGHDPMFQNAGDKNQKNPYFEMIRRALYGVSDRKDLWLQFVKKQGNAMGDFMGGVNGGVIGGLNGGGVSGGAAAAGGLHQQDKLFTGKKMDTFSFANFLKDEREREKERLRALKSIYTDLNVTKEMDEVAEEDKEQDIYQFYAEVKEAIKEEMQVIKKLNFESLIKLLKKDGYTKFESVLFHEPFNPEKPWTWMEEFPKEIPEKYLRRLTDNSLSVLREWQKKQKLAKAAVAEKAQKADKAKLKAAFKSEN